MVFVLSNDDRLIMESNNHQNFDKNKGNMLKKEEVVGGIYTKVSESMVHIMKVYLRVC